MTVSGPVDTFLRKMGYTPYYLRNIKGSEIAGRLEGNDGSDELSKPYGPDSTSASSRTYEEFLNTIEPKSQAIDCDRPLIGCFKPASSYLQSKQNASDITDAIDAIKEELKELSNRRDISTNRDLSALKDKMETLLGKIQGFDPTTGSSGPGSDALQRAGSSGTGNVSSSQSSSAGPAVGGLLGVGTLGAGAAYGLNLVTQVSLYPPLSTSLMECPSNLKEAIDWILRVTGKDGGGGDGTAALAEAVKKLLESVKESNPGFNKQEFENVMNALDGTSGSGGLITKLAEGLQQFIGYEKGKNNGFIRLSGVGRANDPLERLRDAVLGFWLGALMQVSGLLRSKQAHKAKVDEVIGKIYKGFGKGSSGVNGIVGEVEKVSSTVQGNGVQGVNEILEALKADINELKGNAGIESESLEKLGDKVEKYLGKVLGKVKNEAGNANSQVTSLKTKLPAVVTKLKSQQKDTPIDLGGSGIGNQLDAIDGSNGAIKNLGNKLPSLNGKAKNVVNSFYFACAYFSDVLKTGYTSSYPSTATWNGHNVGKCAKIFLACLPLIFNGLSYLYWKFSDEHGWKNSMLGNPEPKAFMNVMTDKSRMFNGNKSGADILSQAFGKFKEFNTAANTSPTSYAEFLKQFRGNCLTTWQNSKSSADNHFLSGLYLSSTSYFRHQHQKKAATARPPSSIREMLYWLMGLTATPQFGDLLGHIHGVVGSGLNVAVSGSSKKDETISADQVTSYILATCYTSPSVLDIIQGSVPPNESKNEPWLHDLYSNSAFPFKYPSSGSALFYALADYTYALQFQLSFLHKQCQDMYINTCGWQFCTFGRDVNERSKNAVVTSHICSVGCTTGGQHRGGNHASGYCEHNGCGSGSKPSPLQAFLTDRLKGFSRSHPSGHSAHLATCSGFLCRMPMGFESHLRDGKSFHGGHISLTLKPFCGSSNTPLRQLCGALTCLSKRAPRSLGDLFGFYWQVTEQLFSSVKKEDRDPTSSLTGAISTLFQKLTTIEYNLLYNTLSDNVKSIGSHFFGLSWHRHRKHSWKTVTRSSGGSYCTDHSNSKKACDLMSLYDAECTENSATCGKYLEPLGISSGATFANDFAFTYLSWAVYLTDDLYELLQEFLEKLNIHACKGCTGCSNGHSGSTCSCKSVVDCADVLPHLYAHGFNFKDAFSLKGMEWAGSSKNKYTQTSKTKRHCSEFANQLQSVIAGNPLSNLLTSIDEFLFLFRYYFLSNLSGFWTIYMGLILYTFFFLLDTLHLRSHLKLTTSHTFPPLALLTSGTPLPMTKLTYITQ
ncbi:variant erythrocyte surface antigen-1 family protein [Babesia caballi]|uniref:Variant erythrocyte surface antigen-1 family protein n=1 Tax=Babesia caballi TaxID=5871 RepID=A0AAV4LTC7_BABCB|nr:variant erythrocyte surface antigen-1 family protein [Babesia caballi]